MPRFYECDEVFERGGAERCCINSEEDVDAAQQPNDGDLRCHKHGQLIGQRSGFYAEDVADARRRLVEEE